MISILSNLAIFAYPQLRDLDGDSRADLLFRNDDGRIACSFNISRNEQLSEHLTPGFEIDSKWHVAIQADLDGDRKTDLLLRNPDGMWEYIPMDRCTPREEDRSLISSLAENHWRIVFALDIDNDGRDELFFRNEEGHWVIQYMDGGDVGSTINDPSGLPLDLNWHFVGSGNLNSDELVDLVFRHSDGTWIQVWRSQVDEITFSSEVVPFVIDPSWREEVIADFDGDGKDELLLRHAGGTWKMGLTYLITNQAAF